MYKDLPDPLLRFDSITNRFVLLEDYVTPEYTVPKGEYTDGASRPEFAEILGVHRYDRHLPACIVHDWMYRYAIGSKREADAMFERNLLRCVKLFGFPEHLVKPMVAAVVVGGRGSY